MAAVLAIAFVFSLVSRLALAFGDDQVQVRLVVETSNIIGAETWMGAEVSFEVRGEWTQPQTFCRDAHRGARLEKRFVLHGLPAQLRLTPMQHSPPIIDAWGFERIALVDELRNDTFEVLQKCQQSQCEYSDISPYWLVFGHSANTYMVPLPTTTLTQTTTSLSSTVTTSSGTSATLSSTVTTSTTTSGTTVSRTSATISTLSTTSITFSSSTSSGIMATLAPKVDMSATTTFVNTNLTSTLVTTTATAGLLIPAILSKTSAPELNVGSTGMLVGAVAVCIFGTTGTGVCALRFVRHNTTSAKVHPWDDLENGCTVADGELCPISPQVGGKRVIPRVWGTPVLEGTPVLHVTVSGSSLENYPWIQPVNLDPVLEIATSMANLDKPTSVEEI